MITGQKIRRPTKRELAERLAETLGLVSPYVSEGASVDSGFLDEIHVALTGKASGGTDTYRKTERVMSAIGLTYDPYWDTSESAGPTGGGTVTNRAFSRILAAVHHRPRAFILNTTDAAVSSEYFDTVGRSYGYDTGVTGRMSLNDAGPGSMIVYYSTSKSGQFPMHFVGHATISYIAPDWAGPWTAALESYQPFSQPVARSQVEIAGWNNQHAITEIELETLHQIVKAGGEGDQIDLSSGTTDPGGAAVARRITKDFPPHQAASVFIPDVVHGTLTPADPQMPTYVLEANDELHDSDPTTSPSARERNQDRDRLAERRAVDVAKQALELSGWTLIRDCQADGCGYDLLFQKGSRWLKVEVKGITGAAVKFNITPKELWRAANDPDFILVAITSVLSPVAFQVHVVARDIVVGADRSATGFRIELN